MTVPIDWDDIDDSAWPDRKFVTPLQWWRNRKKKKAEET